MLRVDSGYKSNPEKERLAMERDEEAEADLTTKGRKRKRLAKACSACHVSAH